MAALHELETKAVVRKGRERVELAWQGTEDAEHWLLKIMAVRQLLQHRYLAKNIHVERTVRLARKIFRADVFAEKTGENGVRKVWIECGGLDDYKERQILNSSTVGLSR